MDTNKPQTLSEFIQDKSREFYDEWDRGESAEFIGLRPDKHKIQKYLCDNLRECAEKTVEEVVLVEPAKEGAGTWRNGYNYCIETMRERINKWLGKDK